MKLSQFNKVLPRFLDAGVSVELFSSPGMGKSEGIEQLVGFLSKRDGYVEGNPSTYKHEWGLGLLFLATQTPTDLMGYMVPQRVERANAEGEVETVTVAEYTEPPWMRCRHGRPLNSYKRGILFIDEYDKGDPDTKKTAAPLLLSGCVGPWQLHDGIGVIAASNRSEDRSGSTKSYDFIINRRGQFTISPDFVAWDDWAVRAGVDPLFRLFARKYPDIVFSGKIPKDQGPFCTPRSLVQTSKLFLDYKIGADPEEEALAHEMACGMIGEGPATQLMAFFKMRTETPDFEDIVKDPEKCPIPKKADAVMLTCYEAAHKVSASTIDAIVVYIKRLQPEFAVTFCKSAVHRDHSLMRSKAMLDWVAKNAALMNSIA